MGFSDNFVWGAATSAYQIEGGVKGAGKGMHIWDVYTKESGKVYGGHTGETACDHYHRFREDVRIMKEIGLKHTGFLLTGHVFCRGDRESKRGRNTVLQRSDRCSDRE